MPLLRSHPVLRPCPLLPFVTGDSARFHAARSEARALWWHNANFAR